MGLWVCCFFQFELVNYAYSETAELQDYGEDSSEESIYSPDLPQGTGIPLLILPVGSRQTNIPLTRATG
jgi:hypothetical protein